MKLNEFEKQVIEAVSVVPKTNSVTFKTIDGEMFRLENLIQINGVRLDGELEMDTINVDHNGETFEMVITAKEGWAISVTADIDEEFVELN